MKLRIDKIERKERGTGVGKQESEKTIGTHVTGPVVTTLLPTIQATFCLQYIQVFQTHVAVLFGAHA